MRPLTPAADEFVDVPEDCLEYTVDANGDFLECSTTSEEWGGFADPGLGDASAGVAGWFGAFFVLVLVLGVAGAAWRVSTARRMAERAGLDPRDAGLMALATDDGLEATYLASALRSRPAEPADPVEPAPEPRAIAPAAERLRELTRLRDEGLLTEAEYAARRQAIIESI